MIKNELEVTEENYWKWFFEKKFKINNAFKIISSFRWEYYYVYDVVTIKLNVIFKLK